MKILLALLFLSATAAGYTVSGNIYTTSGAQANEDAVKFARMLTGRHKILTAYRSFHGSAPGSAAKKVTESASP